jgi:uncharacterized protein
MFGLYKLLVLGAVVAVLWLGFRYVGRVQAIRQALGEELRRRHRAERQRRPLAAEELVKCGVCSVYVPARGASPCGRANCPWGG